MWMHARILQEYRKMLGFRWQDLEWFMQKGGVERYNIKEKKRLYLDM